MSTSYYWYSGFKLGIHFNLGKKIPIGLSAAGWCFQLNVYDELGINSLEDWIKKFNKPFSCITDEYGNYVSSREMLDAIRNRFGVIAFDDVLDSRCLANNAELGPNNLLRCKIDGEYCVGHGDGTWDYIKTGNIY